MKTPALDWSFQANHLALVQRDGTSLGLVVQPTMTAGTLLWLALAVETDARTLEGVLDSHGHVVIGKAYRTQLNAIAAAERYARRWLKQRGDAKCGCKTIGEKKAKGQKR